MKNFDDVRNELKENNAPLFYTLEIIGELMAVRTRKEMSQRELSRLSGVPQKTISRIESGLEPSPKIETLGKLASALKMRIVLVEDSDN